jgi:hypothetical protein
VPPDSLKNGCVLPNWRLGVAPSLATDIRVNGFFGFLDQILDASDNKPTEPITCWGIAGG